MKPTGVVVWHTAGRTNYMADDSVTILLQKLKGRWTASISIKNGLPQFINLNATTLEDAQKEAFMHYKMM